MKTVLLIISVITLYACLLTLIFVIPKPTQIRIDCSLASFHPDYTAEMRKACNERFLNK